MVVFSPIVKRDDKVAWEAYSTSKQGWIAQDLVCLETSLARIGQKVTLTASA
jgi:hypothetical protein